MVREDLYRTFATPTASGLFGFFANFYHDLLYFLKTEVMEICLEVIRATPLCNSMILLVPAKRIKLDPHKAFLMNLELILGFEDFVDWLGFLS